MIRKFVLMKEIKDCKINLESIEHLLEYCSIEDEYEISELKRKHEFYKNLKEGLEYLVR